MKVTRLESTRVNRERLNDIITTIKKKKKLPDLNVNKALISQLLKKGVPISIEDVRTHIFESHF